MIELWKVRAEITVQPEDFPDGATIGFMNIITWADSAEAAREKIASHFQRFDWQIVGVEEAIVPSPDFTTDDDEFHELIERARKNPDAILCGTFHSYKVN